MLRQFVKLPILKTVQELEIPAIRNDLIAGLTVALLAVPQCMAYALIAGLHPLYGLYAALVGVIIGGILSSSDHMILGPTANTSLVVGGVLVGVGGVSPEIAVIYLSVLVGFFQILFGFLRLGNLARFVSHSVITGFVAGASTVIIGDQLIALLGVGGSKSPYFVVRSVEAIRSLMGPVQIDLHRLGLGAGTVLFIVLLRQLHKRMPAGLLAVVAGAGLCAWFSWHQAGIEIIGNIPAQLPALTLPSLNFGLFFQLTGGAMALTLLGSVQAVSVAKSIATSTRQSVDENQELFSLGAANTLAGLFQGFPVSASFSRSFFNFNLGARTRFAALFCGLFIMLTMLVAAPVAYFIPIPVLTGLIIVVVADVFDWSEIKIALSTTYRDLFAFLTTFVSVLVLRLDTAIYAGVAVSIMLYLRKASRLDLREYIIDKEGELKHITDYQERIEPQIALIDVNGEAFFGAAEKIKQRIKNLCGDSEELRVVILRMKNAMNLDITGAMVLKEIALNLMDQGKTLMLCGTTPQIREVLEESSVSDTIGEDKILVAQNSLLESTRQALERARAHIEAVLEGEEPREEEEEPPLRHTMKELKEEEDGDGDFEGEPLQEERIRPNVND